jgi:hypothetical protein
MTGPKVRAAIVFGALAALALLVDRWFKAGFSLGLTVAGLVVVTAAPLALWLSSRDADASPGARRLPRPLWWGLGLTGFGVVAATFGIAPGFAITGSIGSGPPLAPTTPPRAAVRAADAVFPGLAVARAFSTPGGGTTVLFLSPRRRPDTLRLFALWSGGTLTMPQLDWNTVYGPVEADAARLPWAAARQHVALPAHGRVLGPFTFPGYYVVMVPSRGSLYVINASTGEVVSWAL